MRLLATPAGIVPAPAAEAAAPTTNQERRGWLKRLGAALGLGLLAGPTLAAPRGTRQIASADPTLGEIMIFAGNFAPQGWAFCNGQLLSIAQNTALFSLLGTTYGGNGQTNFALPNLQGRFPMHFGQGAGLSNRQLGQANGAETSTLLVNQMPAHNHTLGATTAAATSSSPTGNVLAAPNALTMSNEAGVNVNAYAEGAATTTAGASSIGLAGGNQPHSIMNPFLALNFVIALQGIYPTRS